MSSLATTGAGWEAVAPWAQLPAGYLYIYVSIYLHIYTAAYDWVTPPGDLPGQHRPTLDQYWILAVVVTLTLYQHMSP